MSETKRGCDLNLAMISFFTGFKMPRFKIGENTPLGKIQHIDLYDKLQTLIFLKDANISRGANRDQDVQTKL